MGQFSLRVPAVMVRAASALHLRSEYSACTDELLPHDGFTDEVPRTAQNEPIGAQT